MDLENQITNIREEIGSLVIIHRIQNGREIGKVTYIDIDKYAIELAKFRSEHPEYRITDEMKKEIEKFLIESHDRECRFNQYN